jgi:hypothetical protein
MLRLFFRLISSLQSSLGDGADRSHQSISERVLQVVLNMGFRCLKWEAELGQGKLTLTTLMFRLSELNDQLNFMSRVLSTLRDSSTNKTVDTIETFENNLHLTSETRDILRGMKEAAFEPIARDLTRYMLSGEFRSERRILGSISKVEDIVGNNVPSVLSHLKGSILESGRLSKLARLLHIDITSGRSDLISEMEVSPSRILDPHFASVAIPENLHHKNGLLVNACIRSGLFHSELRLVQDYYLLRRSEWALDIFSSSILDELEKPIKNAAGSAIRERIREATASEFEGIFVAYPVTEVNHTVKSDEDSVLAIRALTLGRTQRPLLAHIFTDGIISKLQSIFRHLLYVSYADYKLSVLWKELQSLKRIDCNGGFAPCNLLLQKMMHFMRSYNMHMGLDVIDSKDWSFCVSSTTSIFKVRDALDKTVGDIIDELHFQNGILKTTYRIIATCTLFAVHITRFIRLNINPSCTLREQADSFSTATSEEAFANMVQKFANTFEEQMSNHFVELKAGRGNPLASVFLSRLDFNGYYKDSMGLN